jgi:hypothetical protein
MSAIVDVRTQRLQEIAKRWRRFAWDYRGLARWLSFDESYLKDPRLPVPLRALLREISLTAILPFGGLALPWWGQIRHRRGPELNLWAARLREPMV